MSSKDVRTAVLVEMALNAANNNGFGNGTVDTQTARDLLQQRLGNLHQGRFLGSNNLNGMNTARQLNFAYGNAVAVNLGVINADNIGMSNADVARQMLATGTQNAESEQTNNNEAESIGHR